jgi:hypothetical protein
MAKNKILQPEFSRLLRFFIPQKYSMVIDQYPKYLYLIGSFLRNKKNEVNEKTQAVEFCCSSKKIIDFFLDIRF